MTKFTNIVYFVCVASISLLLACTPKNNQVSPKNNEKKTVSLFIWSNYVSEESLREFEKKYDIKVIVSNFASNEELLSKLQAGATGYDVIVPSDYMVTIMTKLKLLLPLKKEQITNLKEIDPKFLKLPFDNENQFSLPYGWATAGIAVNRQFYKGKISGWKDLFENKDLKGKVNMLDDHREVFAAALKLNGQSLNSLSREEITKAKDYLKKIKPQIKSFNSDPIELLSSGEVWVSQMYSSDALQAREKAKGQVEFILPVEGSTQAVDNLAIPVGAQNIEAAHLLIDHLLSKENNLSFVKRIFAGPVIAATKASLPVELQKDVSLFPTAEMSKKFEMMVDLGEVTSFYDQVWTELKSE